MLSPEHLSELYARALFCAALEKGVEQELADSMRAIKTTFSALEAETRRFFTSVAVPLETKYRAIDRAFGASLRPEALSFLKRAARKRLAIAANVADAYAHILETEDRRIRVCVRTAYALTKEERERLSALFGKRYGKNATLVETIDPSLIGGLEITVGDDRYDYSVSGQLARLAKQTAVAETDAERYYGN